MSILRFLIIFDFIFVFFIIIIIIFILNWYSHQGAGWYPLQQVYEEVTVEAHTDLEKDTEKYRNPWEVYYYLQAFFEVFCLLLSL